MGAWLHGVARRTKQATLNCAPLRCHGLYTHSHKPRHAYAPQSRGPRARIRVPSPAAFLIFEAFDAKRDRDWAENKGWRIEQWSPTPLGPREFESRLLQR